MWRNGRWRTPARSIPREVALSVFNENLFAFETVSLLLLAAVVGGVWLGGVTNRRLPGRLECIGSGALLGTATSLATVLLYSMAGRHWPFGELTADAYGRSESIKAFLLLSMLGFLPGIAAGATVWRRLRRLQT